MSFKLGIDLNKYIPLIDYDDPIEIDKLKLEADLHRRNRKFIELNKILVKLSSYYLESDTQLQQYIQWNQAICIYETTGDFDLAIKMFLGTLSLTVGPISDYKSIEMLTNTCFTRMEFHIITSIAKIYGDINNINEAISISKALVKNLEDHVLNYQALYVYHSLLYNLSVYLCEIDNNHDALIYADKLLELSEKFEETTLFAKIMYQKSIIEFNLSNVDYSLKLAKRALTYFNFRGFDEYFSIIDKEIKERYTEEMLTHS